MSELVYSPNGEDGWTEDFDEMRIGIVDCMGPECGPYITYYEGTMMTFTHADFVCSNQILEHMQELAFDEVGEVSEDYLLDLGDEEIKELKSLIVKFLNEKAKQPEFYRVIKVVKQTDPLTPMESKMIEEQSE